MCFRLFPLALATCLLGCQMPDLPAAPLPTEDGLLLKNVRFYSAEGNQLQLFGEFAEVRFAAQQHLLKSARAQLLWVPQQLRFQAESFNVRTNTQEAWAPAYWKFQTADNAFGEGTDAYAYKDSLGNMYVQTPKPLQLWQEENFLSAEAANCEVSTKNCEFLGTVETTLYKAE